MKIVILLLSLFILASHAALVPNDNRSTLSAAAEKETKALWIGRATKFDFKEFNKNYYKYVSNIAEENPMYRMRLNVLRCLRDYEHISTFIYGNPDIVQRIFDYAKLITLKNPWSSDELNRLVDSQVDFAMSLKSKFPTDVAWRTIYESTPNLGGWCSQRLVFEDDDAFFLEGKWQKKRDLGEEVPILIGHNNELAVKDTELFFELWLAVELGNEEVVKRLLNQKMPRGRGPWRELADRPNPTPRTSAFFSWNGRTNDEYEYQTHKFHQRRRLLTTPLHVACSRGHVEVVRKLMEYSIVNQLDRDGHSPLYKACEQGNEEVVDILLKLSPLLDIDVNSDANKEDSPLLIALKNGHKGVIDKLLKSQKVHIPASVSVEYGSLLNNK